MSRSLLLAGLSLAVGGCALVPPTHLGGISATIPPEEYGSLLCAHLDLEAYPSCVSQVLDYFENRARPEDLPMGHSTSGPFAVMMEGSVYIGDYKSTPFTASFWVSNGEHGCRGSYNAFAGSADALFDVYCDDGRAGWADLILAGDGRNGIGKIALDDGTQGDIVFGYTPLGQAVPNAGPDAG